MDYWWIKKFNLTLIKGHEIKTVDTLEIINLSANEVPIENTYNIPGDRFLIKGKFKNVGEFNTILPIRVEVTNDLSNTKWVLQQQLPININQEEEFQFNFPSLGLDTGNYHINVSASEPEDYLFDDNAFSKIVFVDSIQPLICDFNLNNYLYETGDSIHVNVFIHYENHPITSANARVTIHTPEGKKITNKLVYNEGLSQYESSFLANLGGNYYIDVEANSRRYKQGFASTYVQTKVDLYIESLGRTAKKGEIENLLLTC